MRKSFKLNAQNVYPDSYSRMKVKPAAEVMSRTVSNDLNSQQWPGTSETSDFIMRVNNWFDLLNGAFSYQGTKTRNHRLNGYTVKDLLDFENGVQGNRFEELLDFLNYLEEWKQDVQLRINNSAVTVLDDLGVMPLEEAASFHVLNDSQQEETEDDAKNLLPHQTLVGIEMSTRAFIDVVSFLLREGVPFVNARDFTQDPLEQNFGKQRMGGGGSSNPNVKQYLEKQKKIHIIGQLAMSNKRGNTEGNEENVLTCEALPKKKYVKKKGLD